MRVYHDDDADLRILEGKRIAVIGYGNQGRSQALNLRDSGLEVVVGNREDEYAEQARQDGLSTQSIARAVAEGDVVMLLIPDEVMPQVFEREIARHLAEGDGLVFASGYNIAFELFTPPPSVDVVLVAPRMIGAGVRDLYVAGRGFPSFIGVAQDYSGQAKATALALAKGIGSTRAGVVEVTFAQETELDLFTEQCFGPAFGHVLTTAANLLIDEGYPPEAVLLELYMSGELSYTLAKIAELGLIAQSRLHSSTSQYGSMSRGMRFMLPELRTKMAEGLEEIRSGQFAREWAEEQEAGCATLAMLREAALSLPLHQQEEKLLQALGDLPSYQPPQSAGASSAGAQAMPAESTPRREVLVGDWGFRVRAFLRHVLEALGWGKAVRPACDRPLTESQRERVLERFLSQAAGDPALQTFSRGRTMTVLYVLSEPELEFWMHFDDGTVTTAMGSPPSPADVRLETKADVLDGMFTGRINAMRAAITGKLTFSGEARMAMSQQQVQGDMCRLYARARDSVLASEF
jgi:ketol-acid reductoisomerase